MGPLFQVEVHIPSVLATVMANVGQTIPPPVTGWALIDTGATYTAIDDGAATKLGLSPVGVTTGGTAGGPATHSLYPVRLMFPGVGLDREFEQAAGVNLTGQMVGNHQIIALIGRDVLSGCVLTYNGVAGLFTLAW